MSKQNKHQPRTNAGGATVVMMKAKDVKMHPMARVPRAQVSGKFERWLEESPDLSAEPSFPVGEYLGDLEVTGEMLLGLKNINPFVNRIPQVQRSTYVLWADFDWTGDGHFIGLRLEPLRAGERTERTA